MFLGLIQDNDKKANSSLYMYYYIPRLYYHCVGDAMAEWLSSWLAEQEDQSSIPGLATWIFRDWLFPASKSRYGWKIAKSTLILKTTNQISLLCGLFIKIDSLFLWQTDVKL